MTQRHNSQGRGSVALYGLICLFACVCVFVFVGPMHALAKVMALMPDTSYFDANFMCCAKQSCSNMLNCVLFSGLKGGDIAGKN